MESQKRGERLRHPSAAREGGRDGNWGGESEKIDERGGDRHADSGGEFRWPSRWSTFVSGPRTWQNVGITWGTRQTRYPGWRGVWLFKPSTPPSPLLDGRDGWCWGCQCARVRPDFARHPSQLSSALWPSFRRGSRADELDVGVVSRDGQKIRGSAVVAGWWPAGRFRVPSTGIHPRCCNRGNRV